jgi:hypothetical protein
MQPTFQTSFIPKKSIINDPVHSSNVVRDVSIVSTISSIIFVVSLVTFCSLFLYKIILLKQIAKADEDLKKARSAFQIEKIQELVDTNSRILSTKRLLNTHVSTSKLLDLMQNLTVKKVRLTKLTYSTQNNIPTLSMEGESQTYNAIVEQSNIFSQNKYIVNPLFGDFTLQDNGYVKITFTSGIDTAAISYRDVEEPVNNSTQTDESLIEP